MNKKTLNTLLASAVALTMAGGIGAANAMDDTQEKCYGVVKAGHNDCGNASKSHSCAGHAAVDGASDEWVALPKGTCDKIVGGSTTSTEVDAEAAADTEAAVDAEAEVDAHIDAEHDAVTAH